MVISGYDSFDNVNKMLEFEKVVNEFILKTIEGNNVSISISEYEKMNNNIMNISPTCYKELIIENYDPLIYDQKIYPDIQYFLVSKKKILMHLEKNLIHQKKINQNIF